MEYSVASPPSRWTWSEASRRAVTPSGLGPYSSLYSNLYSKQPD